MHCLHCGGCCKTMSPKSAPFQCPDLIQREGMYFCRCYERSPEICRNFGFDDQPACLFGLNELRLSYPEDREIIEERRERGIRIIRELQQKKLS